MAQPSIPRSGSKIRDTPCGSEDDNKELSEIKGELYEYQDYAAIPRLKSIAVAVNGNMKSCSHDRFPSKLYAILSTPSFSSIISWLPHGRSWKIWDTSLLEEMVLPVLFENANYSSFLRLVNAWSFRRIKNRSKKRTLHHDSYYHELFLRGRPDLLSSMKRLPKGTRKLPMKKSAEPDFTKFQALPSLQDSGKNEKKISADKIEESMKDNVDKYAPSEVSKNAALNLTNNHEKSCSNKIDYTQSLLSFMNSVNTPVLNEQKCRKEEDLLQLMHPKEMAELRHQTVSSHQPYSIKNVFGRCHNLLEPVQPLGNIESRNTIIDRYFATPVTVPIPAPYNLAPELHSFAMNSNPTEKLPQLLATSVNQKKSMPMVSVNLEGDFDFLVRIGNACRDRKGINKSNA